MQPVHVEATVGKGGTLNVSGLPFQEGQVVEVSIALHATPASGSSSHPLAGLPVTYIDPFEPAVPPEDWEALQ
jgi:hypothetical protein